MIGGENLILKCLRCILRNQILILSYLNKTHENDDNFRLQNELYQKRFVPTDYLLDKTDLNFIKKYKVKIIRKIFK